MRILKDLSTSIEGEDVLIVEDIIDTGLTLNYLVRYLRGKKPASLRICTLLDKPARRLVDIAVDYRGFTIPDQFVVGYGLDYGELYRNLRFVGVLRPEVYTGRRMSMHRRPSAAAGRLARSVRRHRSLAASCRGGRSAATTACRRSPATLRVAAASSCSSRRSRPSPWSRCHMRRERPVGADRWQIYAIFAGAGWLGFVGRIIDLGLSQAFASVSLPTRLSRIPGCGSPASGSRSSPARSTTWPASGACADGQGLGATLGEATPSPDVDQIERLKPPGSDPSSSV